MALKAENIEYLDILGRGPGGRVVTNALKEVLTDANVTALKAKVKAQRVTKLTAEKAELTARIAALK